MNNIIKKTDNRPTTLGSVVDELFQHNFNRFFDDRLWGLGTTQGDTRVPVNIRETETQYEIEVIAPGLKKEDFTLSVNRDILTVSFELKEEKTDSRQKSWIRREFSTRSFSRSFTVDHTVDTDKATATYENGILLLNLPKKEEARPISKNITVQ
jgi:HSP20 family protein